MFTGFLWVSITELCSRGSAEEREVIAPWSPAVQSGACRMFPQRKLWEAPLRLWPALQIMTIPVLIRVLWLMFDEEGDRLSGCFRHVFTHVSCKTGCFFSKRSGQPTPPGILSLLRHQHSLVKVVVSLEVVFHVSSSENCFCSETTVIAKPCWTTVSRCTVQFRISWRQSFKYLIAFPFPRQHLALPDSFLFWHVPPRAW